MYGYGNEKKTDRERFLEDELERERQSAREAEEREYEARERSRKERRAEYEQEQRSASSWPEALQKQAWLCQREINQYDTPEMKGYFEPEDGYFANLVKANEAALKIWHKIAAARQAEIDAIWNSIRNQVADELEAESDRSEYKQTAQALRDDELENYLDW